MRSFISGMSVGVVVSYLIIIGSSFALEGDLQENEFVLARHEVAVQEGRRVSRSTMCNDCMDDMGKVLYNISYLSGAMSEVQEKLLDAVYGYAKKKKSGFLAHASRGQLHDFDANLRELQKKCEDAIVSADQIIGQLAQS